MTFLANYERIALDFTRHYYNLFDNGRNDDLMRQQLRDLYHPQALMTFENTQVQGQDQIMSKLRSLQFQQISRMITKVDSQPMLDGSLHVVAIGLIKSDDDIPLSFVDSFVLSSCNNKYYITSQIFRLVIHDVPFTT